ncbi:MAG: erythromycin esterase family protein [Pseudobdellovibrionaceae bacterium]
MEAVIAQLENRRQAGEFLAEKIKGLSLENPILFALPRGGVPVAEPIAKALQQNLNLLLVKRIPIPGNPEVAMGAIVEDGKPIWQDLKNLSQKPAKADLDRAVVKARQSISRQRHLWKVDSRVIDLKDQTVVLIDDGLATGSTLKAALDFLKKRGPQKIIVAIPVGHPAAIEKISKSVDSLIYLMAPENFRSVSEFYGQFEKVTDRQVAEVLDRINQPEIPTPEPIKNPIVKEVMKTAVPLRQPSHLSQLLKKMSQCRVVMLGESTHGTLEFYQLRRLISQKLIEDHGFQFIAVEGDWPDCWKLNRYIQSGDGGSARKVMESFHRWPTWMWANEETEKLIQWMRLNQKGNFYGLDVYSLFESIDAVKKFARDLSPELQEDLLRAYSCFDPFERNEKAYAKALVQWPHGCQDEVLASLRKLLRLRLEQTDVDAPDLFNAQRNAQIITNAEKYYRSMIEGSEESWNIRDEHMLQTLDALLHQHGEGSKAVVWAHNTHIGDYHATDMLKAGYINLGGLAREKYGMDNVFLVGFGTHSGEVLAGKAWGASAEVMKIPDAKSGSYESDFHQVAERLSADRFFVTFNRSKATLLNKTQGHRAIGVVYESHYEKTGHNYVPTSLANRYDAFVFVDRTSALKPITTEMDRKDLPETWPSGI